MDLISLLTFVSILILCVFKKLNTGLICYGAAIILGRFVCLTDKEIVAGFDYNLFLMLFGVTLLLGIAKSNGALELLAKKCLSITGKYPPLLPISVYCICLILSACGAGCMPTMTIMMLFSLMLIKPLGMSPLLFAFVAMEGADGGNLSPLSTTGVVGLNLCEKIGLGDVGLSLLYAGILSTIMNVALGYLVFKGWKYDRDASLNLGILPKFNKKQIAVLLGILSMSFSVFVLKAHVGLVSMTIASILFILGLADEKDALSNVPWNVLAMTTGVMVLINIVTKAGGISLMSSYMASLMTKDTIIPIFSICSGMLSWVSSTTSVVMPTMISAIPEVVTKVGSDVNLLELASSLTMNAHVAGISPFSSGGALALAAYTTVYEPSKKDIDRFFLCLFAIAILGVFYQALLGYLGLFKIVLL